ASVRRSAIVSPLIPFSWRGADSGCVPVAVDHLDVDVAAGVRVVVVSDLHLTAPATDSSKAAAATLAEMLAAWQGPGVVVLAGDVVELLSGQPVVDAATALAPYALFACAARSFSRGE